ncbi:putative disease resistance protein RGA4 [Triticum urartu]|uniref:putative disease resistance protein RGA4 n=1 Tax=Triticum urartu TaxID=4572 RepID=UPI0020431D53|nr:putative disease resistance protein RGA4 [Triticum urartu]
MAAVLDSLASYVADMVIEMAKEEVAMLIGVAGEIENLGIKLRDLKNFLADADRRNITDESVQGWVEELKRAMYDVTDILDLCQLKVMEQGPSKDMGCLNPLLFCMRNPLHTHNIGSRIKTLNQKLDDIFKRGSSFNFIKLEAYQDRMVTRSQAVDRKTDPLLERSRVVGEKIEDDTRALVKVLTEEVADDSDSIMIVAIVGVGGIGKTTLSKKVFNDEAIQGKFAKKIWLSITQVFNEVELLRTAITAANGNLPGSGGGSQDKALLVPALADAVRDKKIFLVLDDMWGTNEWNNLLMAPFSHAASNSRILVTTRHETVALGMKAKHPYHHVGKLGPEDAWTLLKKQVLATEKSEPAIDMLKDIGLEIIEKCDGLPLAIKVMGGLLCQKDKQRCDWEKVLNDAIWSISRMPEELNYAIYISYGDLSPSLKQCFLHFSLKPKKTIIHDVQLVGMWIGEGFVHGDSDRLEELGIEYHKELILRNLIESDTSYAGQYICNMHDVVRSFAQYVTRDEALVAHRGGTGNSKLSLQRFLRLSIETRGVESDEFEWRSLHEQKSLRSLILVGKFKIQSGDSLIPFSNLRTLHIEYANFAALFKSLYQLKHLRYLALRECNDIKSLPENIHKMKFLQHISVAGCQNLVKLPDTIVKLQGLRYLELYSTSVSSMPRGFSALTNLRILWGFHTHMDGDWCSLEELQPLSQLGEIGLASLENVSAASFATKARLSEKVYLSCMALYCKSRLGDDGLVKEEVSEQDQGTIMEVFDELHPPPYVQDIRIQGYFGRQLPKWMMSTATTPLNSLRILIFEDLACCTQLPDGLCQLPYLDYLEVNRAPAIKRVGPEFLHPYSHHHHASFQALAAFPRLNKMIFRKMVELEEWDWEEEVQAMPVLEELIIHGCKLRRIPLGLVSHARALKKLTIWSIQCLHSLENFASVVELDLYDLPELTSISNLPKLQKLAINCCPKLESLQEMTALRVENMRWLNIVLLY